MIARKVALIEIVNLFLRRNFASRTCVARNYALDGELNADKLAAMQSENLSRRERQIMDVVYRLGVAGAAEVQEAMPDPPSYSAVRAQLTILEEKGFLKHEKRAKRSALKNLLATFFDNSAEKLVAALLDPKDQKLSSDEIERIRRLVDEGRFEEEKAS